MLRLGQGFVEKCDRAVPRQRGHRFVIAGRTVVVKAVVRAFINERLISDAAHDSVEEIALRGRLQGSLLAAACFRGEAERLLGNARLVKYKEYDGLIFDSATGEAFEMIARKQELGTATAVIGYCHQMRSELRSDRSQH